MCHAYPVDYLLNYVTLSLMNVSQAIILGIIQGFTEFLPVSSSGHLIFLPNFFGWQDQGVAFDAMIHLGTLAAVVYYFRVRLLSLFHSFFHKRNTEPQVRRLAWYIIASFLPAAIIGFLIEEVLDISIRSSIVVAISLIAWAIVLGLAEVFYSHTRGAKKSIEGLTWPHVWLISFAQAVALIPGTSRSGITMTAGLFSNLSREAAAEFSFLISIPVIAAAGSVGVLRIFTQGSDPEHMGVLVAGFLSAAVSGLLAIRFLMAILHKHGFMPFVVYRIAMGILIILLIV